MRQQLNKILMRVAGIGADPNDDDNLRLQKSLLVFCAFPSAAWSRMDMVGLSRSPGPRTSWSRIDSSASHAAR